THHLVARQERTFTRPPRRVPDHPRRSAGEGNGVMSRQLKATQDEEGDQVADVETVGGGVEARVKRGGKGKTPRQALAIGDVGDEATPGEVGEETLGGFGRSAHREASTIPSR